MSNVTWQTGNTDHDQELGIYQEGYDPDPRTDAAPAPAVSLAKLEYIVMGSHIRDILADSFRRTRPFTNYKIYGLLLARRFQIGGSLSFTTIILPHSGSGQQN
jgi:hypothetical protein